MTTDDDVPDLSALHASIVRAKTTAVATPRPVVRGRLVALLRPAPR